MLPLERNASKLLYDARRGCLNVVFLVTVTGSNEVNSGDGAIILNAHQQSDMSIERMNRYFGEVFNRLDEEHVLGLQAYLTLCCGMTEELEFMW